MMKRSQEKYDLSGPLRDISHRQLQALTKIEPARSAIEYDLNIYIEQNKQLKIKCSKIDQIQKCANILMENVEKYKKKNRELQIKMVQLTNDNDKLRVQVQKVANVKFLKEENLRKQGEISGLRKKMEINDNFHVIRLQQQLSNEKQARDRMISNLEAKHKSDVSKLEHQLKISLNKLEHDNQMLKERTEGLVKQNAHLKTNTAQLDSEVRTMIMENQHLQEELIRAQDLLVQAENQINLLNENYCEIKVRSEEAINTLTLQVHRLSAQIDKSVSMQTMLERMNGQLKNEGGILILQNQQMKARTLQLQQLHLIDLTNIKNLQSQLNSMMDSVHILQNKMVDKDIANMHTMDTVERDNIILRKSMKDLQLEMSTKQKEIQDLIIIVAKLQAEIKVISSSNTAIQQTNDNLLNQINQKQINIDSLSSSNQSHLMRVSQLESKLSQAEASFRNLANQKKQMEQLLNREKQSVIEMEKILQIEKNHLGDEKAVIQQLQRELKQKQAFAQGWKDGKEQYEKMFTQQRQSNLLYKNQVQELEGLVIKVEQLMMESEQQKKKLKELFQGQKVKTIQEGMQQMEQLISKKYDQILKEYQQHYDIKIAALQNQIKQFTNQLQSSQANL